VVETASEVKQTAPVVVPEIKTGLRDESMEFAEAIEGGEEEDDVAAEGVEEPSKAASESIEAVLKEAETSKTEIEASKGVVEDMTPSKKSFMDQLNLIRKASSGV
jgi:hypothetical protein